MSRAPTAAEQAAYDELLGYTLTHGGKEFIHQYAVDAWMAQYADERTKPIGITFALVGLYLHLERGFTGRQAQLAHVTLGRRKEPWPAIALPESRGALTVRDVMAAPAGPARDRELDAWCASVWAAYAHNRDRVAELLTRRGIA
ncbi:MAG: hypothetical protein KGN74_06250 [Gemmatimonadota bacterium]|nr:hypothetical protein [Gemmatimonadota bacterium]MDE3172657.1 hypothetical protein [Gemmatimonadota bacterium]MDE3216446.1 hypothetical protein [Gemmatimonadota bacterium]